MRLILWMRLILRFCVAVCICFASFGLNGSVYDYGPGIPWHLLFSPSQLSSEVPSQEREDGPQMRLPDRSILSMDSFVETGTIEHDQDVILLFLHGFPPFQPFEGPAPSYMGGRSSSLVVHLIRPIPGPSSLGLGMPLIPPGSVVRLIRLIPFLACVMGLASSSPSGPMEDPIRKGLSHPVDAPAPGGRSHVSGETPAPGAQ